jgi:uncharacterized protein with PIN domain
MARLYTNENFPLQAAARLRLLGHDVLTTQDAGNANRSLTDEEVLAFSKREERAVITLNRRHFVRLHEAHPDHSGIIVCTFDPEFEDLADRIDRKLRGTPDLAGQLVRVQRN